LAKQKRWVCVGGINALRAALWRLSTFKNTFLSCYWKCHHVLFLLVWYVSLLVVWFEVNEHFFFFFFLLSPQKITAQPSWLLAIQFLFLFFWFLIFFNLESFVEVLFVFNFILPSQFTKYYIPPMWSLFFRFLFSIIGSFVKNLVVFNFIF
jgi:hypothetical protein